MNIFEFRLQSTHGPARTTHVESRADGRVVIAYVQSDGEATVLDFDYSSLPWGSVGNARYRPLDRVVYRDPETGDFHWWITVYHRHNSPPRVCLLYTSPSPRDRQKSRMPSSA